MATKLTKSVERNAAVDAITKMTFSAWIKRGKLGEAEIFSAHQLSSYYTDFYFNSDDALILYSFIASSTAANVVTKRVFKDVNAWYHIMLVVDTTLATASDRIKFYVNGVRETETDGGTTFPSQDSGFGQFNDTGATLCLGENPNRTAFKGSISHVHYTPYQAYDASYFGSTDSTTGEWKINTSPSVNYGTVGWFILKDGNSVTDQSGNGKNFTVASGTLTNTEDCPSNVFAVWNPLNMTNSNMNFTNGNTKLSSSVAWLGQIATLAMPSGKYYWEIKYSGGNYGVGVGTWGMASTNTNDLSNSNYGYVGKYPGGYELFQNSGQPHKINNSNNDGNYGSQAASGGIIMVAYDADNNKLFTGLNGTWNDSSDPANGTSPMYTTTSGKLYAPSCSIENGTLETNFGNGYFGTTYVSSAGTNASGNGIFEYDVPTGFTALSTKGLNL